MLLTPVTGRFRDGVGVGHIFIHSNVVKSIKIKSMALINTLKSDYTC